MASPENFTVLVSRHAIKRLRLRFGITRRWTFTECESWICRAAVSSPFTIDRRNGEILAQANLHGRCVWLAIAPAIEAPIWWVKTVLPHAFAENNLNHRHLR